MMHWLGQYNFFSKLEENRCNFVSFKLICSELTTLINYGYVEEKRIQILGPNYKISNVIEVYFSTIMQYY